MKKDLLSLKSNCPSDENVTVYLEELNKCVYLYVAVDEDGERKFTTSAWVLNTGKAPKKFNWRHIRLGRPPRMMRLFCAHPAGIEVPNIDDLQFLWSDNEAVILIEKDKVLTVIENYKCENPKCYSRYITMMSPYGDNLSKLSQETADKLTENGFKL